MDDPYWAVVCEHWPKILQWYQLFADKKPVMLFDIQEQRIYAYPYKEFKADLSQRSQARLDQPYRKTAAHNQIVVFVRDNEKRKLVSYTVSAGGDKT